MAGSVKTDMLFLGLTRPPMIFGVGYTFALVNLFVCLIVYILTTEMKYFVMMFPLHFLGYYLTLKDPLFMTLYSVRSAKCSRASNRFTHGANSYDPI